VFVLFVKDKTGGIVMIKSIFLFLFPLVFMIFISLSIGLALQNNHFHKPINTGADTDGSDDEGSILSEESEELKILEEELEQQKNKYQNREKEVDPGIVLDNPEMLNKVDPGIFLGDPEESMIEIDPDIIK
jgi:hypothetical protein